jgi:hypothetical protein
MKASLANYLVIALGLGAPWATAGAAPLQDTTAGDTTNPAIGIASSETTLRVNCGLPTDLGLVFPQFDEPGDGALWVIGENYKARFDSSGLQFIPNFGPDAPQNYPITFSIRSARVGARELTWKADAAPERASSIVTYHRGAFDEVFEVGPESIEHKFVFAERVSGGDLMIAIRTEGELERSSDILGTCFANERGAVSYGNATLIDARAQTIGSLTQLVDDTIVISAPASELERAVFPLTVDPVITSFSVNSTVNTPAFPDTSYDLTTNTWLCVYQLTYSSADHDILATQISGSGALITSVYVDLTGSDWTKPRVANCNAQNQFMVVAQVNLPTSRISARRVMASGASMSAQFDISPSSPNDTFQSPDIGGDDFPVGTPAYCVAYLAVGHGVWFSRVSPTGTVSAATQLSVGPPPMGPVRISKSNGHWSYGDQRWTVGWQEVLDPNHPSWGTVLFVRQIDLGGHPLGSFGTQFGNHTPYFSISPLLDEYGPERRFYVANSFTCPTCDGQLYILLGTRFGFASEFLLIVDENLDGVTKKLDCSVETDGSRFYVVYAESPGYDSNVYMASGFSDGQGLVVTQSHVPVGASVLNEGTPSLASKHTSGGFLPDAMCAWKRFAGTFTKGGITISYPDTIFGAVIN